MTAFAATVSAVATQILAGLARELGKAGSTAEVEDDALDVGTLNPAAQARIDALIESLDFGPLDTLRTPAASLLADLATQGATQGLLTVRALVPLAGAFALPSDTIVTWARDHAASLVGKRVLGDGTVIDNPNTAYAITEATRELLRGTIADIFATPDITHAAIVEQLQAAYAFSAERATLIARTEISGAYVEGNTQAWRASGVVEGTEWILGSEHDVDDDCDANAAAGVVPLGATFPSGVTAPPAHPRCVCDVLPVLTDGSA